MDTLSCFGGAVTCCIYVDYSSSLILFLMRVLLAVVCLLAVANTLPYVEQMLLANSMIVGRDDGLDLINWECNVCAP